MQDLANQPPSSEEAWELGWDIFLAALKVMCAEPSEQCELMGNFNVAWELKNDVLAGEYLINSPHSRISAQQRNMLNELFRELRALPADALGQPNTSEGNLRGMGHSAWTAVRIRARQTLVAMERA